MFIRDYITLIKQTGKGLGSGEENKELRCALCSVIMRQTTTNTKVFIVCISRNLVYMLNSALLFPSRHNLVFDVFWDGPWIEEMMCTEYFNKDFYVSVCAVYVKALGECGSTIPAEEVNAADGRCEHALSQLNLEENKELS